MTERSLTIGTHQLQLPCFFPSVSSVKTNISPQEYIDHLEHLGYPCYLISAYDVLKSKKRNKQSVSVSLPKKMDRDSIVFLDSGNYEAYWFDDHDWPYESYQSAANSIDADLYLSYDNCWQKEDKDYQIPKQIGDKEAFIPIIHGSPTTIPELAVEIAMKERWQMIAIPERELGDSISSRINTIQNIRKSLRINGIEIPIHLLGTGHPISILLYSAFGADSFDGLEWCQTIVNPKNGQLFHFTQKDFIDCRCDACTSGMTSYLTTILFHNLLFYIDWMVMIQKALQQGTIKDMMKKYIPEPFYKSIEGNV